MFGGMGNMRGMRHMRGGLRMWVIYMLRDHPMNGAEIMDAIEERSMGMWRPSPGSVYPMLETLSDEGLIKKREDGKYELTKEGKANAGFGGFFSGKSPRSASEVVAEIGNYLSFLEDLKVSEPSEIKENKEEISKLADRLRELAK